MLRSVIFIYVNIQNKDDANGADKTFYMGVKNLQMNSVYPYRYT